MDSAALDSLAALDLSAAVLAARADLAVAVDAFRAASHAARRAAIDGRRADRREAGEDVRRAYLAAAAARGVLRAAAALAAD